ncbi:hypothetical protein T01_14652 [Trichinella spiralis]|uniref:Uncharacterized protein n=1 Tax=Trichinella spiralis TaxID=6334 RepID=A0A0V1C1N5_TRISP|nr:hypothetical protein T01_14652 [Trichinella spiralis]
MSTAESCHHLQLASWAESTKAVRFLLYKFRNLITKLQLEIRVQLINKALKSRTKLYNLYFNY